MCLRGSRRHWLILGAAPPGEEKGGWQVRLRTGAAGNTPYPRFTSRAIFLPSRKPDQHTVPASSPRSRLPCTCPQFTAWRPSLPSSRWESNFPSPPAPPLSRRSITRQRRRTTLASSFGPICSRPIPWPRPNSTLVCSVGRPTRLPKTAKPTPYSAMAAGPWRDWHRALRRTPTGPPAGSAISRSLTFLRS